MKTLTLNKNGKQIEAKQLECNNAYYVTKEGDIWSTKSNKFLKVQNHPNGYRTIRIHNTYMMHKLILSTFFPNGNAKAEVDHIDGNKANNNLSNLRWVSRKVNAKNVTKNRNYKYKRLFKCVKDEVEHSFNLQKEAALYIGCDPSAVCFALQGKLKTVNGYKLQYV